MAEEIVMQMTVTAGEEGLEVITHFAEGYTEESLAEVFEMWADETLDPNPSPGWGKM